MANKDIDSILKHGLVPVTTPSMSSTSLNGFTVSYGYYGCFNYDVGWDPGSVGMNGYYPYGFLDFPAPIAITSMDVGDAIGEYYTGTSGYVRFYMGGVNTSGSNVGGTQVGYYPYNPRSNRGATLQVGFIVCTSVLLGPATGSPWGAGGVQQSTRFNGFYL